MLWISSFMFLFIIIKESNCNLLPNCSDNKDLPEVILCLFEYFGCQNIIKAKAGILNVGKVLEKARLQQMEDETLERSSKRIRERALESCSAIFL